MQRTTVVTNSTEREKPINPHMIVTGREARGLSQIMLADALKVTQGRLSKIEAGLLPVTDDLLTDMARVLDYPLHFFRQEGANVGVGVAEIFHRKRRDVPQKTLLKVYANMEIRRRHVAALYRSVDVPTNVPRLDPDEFGGRVEEIAHFIRATWGQGPGPIDDLTKLLENAGIIIVPVDFETSRVDAISRWVPDLPPLIFINRDSPKDRLRFSLAHELGHLVMHTYPTADAETQADRFAAELLLPAREIRPHLRGLTLAKLVVLKRYWLVSMAAILKRAQDTGAITENNARYLWAQMARAGYRTREPAELDVAGELPCLLQELVDVHRMDLGYTVDDIAKMIPLNDDEMSSLYPHPSDIAKKPKHRLRLVQ
jgi:Zn-dependent peptidase ImmA (M78 family)/transcriptional regulator with XRE-family HTH domain